VRELIAQAEEDKHSQSESVVGGSSILVVFCTQREEKLLFWSTSTQRKEKSFFRCLHTEKKKSSLNHRFIGAIRTEKRRVREAIVFPVHARV
jgi:hypothetical protein